MMRNCRPLLPPGTGCLTVGNVRKIHMRSDTCPNNQDEDGHGNGPHKGEDDGDDAQQAVRPN